MKRGKRRVSESRLFANLIEEAKRKAEKERAEEMRRQREEAAAAAAAEAETAATNNSSVSLRSNGEDQDAQGEGSDEGNHSPPTKRLKEQAAAAEEQPAAASPLLPPAPTTPTPPPLPSPPQHIMAEIQHGSEADSQSANRAFDAGDENDDQNDNEGQQQEEEPESPSNVTPLKSQPLPQYLPSPIASPVLPPPPPPPPLPLPSPPLPQGLMPQTSTESSLLGATTTTTTMTGGGGGGLELPQHRPTVLLKVHLKATTQKAYIPVPAVLRIGTARADSSTTLDIRLYHQKGVAPLHAALIITESFQAQVIGIGAAQVFPARITEEAALPHTTATTATATATATSTAVATGAASTPATAKTVTLDGAFRVAKCVFSLHTHDGGPIIPITVATIVPKHESPPAAPHPALHPPTLSPFVF